ncbi:MAG: RagB/SusD family nutrient uptake outer membrane protein [Paludibacter sp.]
MKKLSIKLLFTLIVLINIFSSCKDDLLYQPSSYELPSSEFWKNLNDAEAALNGAEADIRYIFSRDYYLDGMGDQLYVSGNLMERISNRTDISNSAKLRLGAAYDGFYELFPSGYGGKFANMYKYCYGGINRCNYILDGFQKMIEKETLPTNVSKLEEFVGEAKVLRSLLYLRLISMFGDVPYIDERIYKKEEVETISRTPIADIEKSLVEDLTYAIEKLPTKSDKIGRMAKPAALALRGKIQLYWASWNKFGWPELDSFIPNEQVAQDAYIAAAKDFRSVIDDYGLTLFRNGEPGECDELGKASKLPNYYYLFLPTANGDSEFILSFNFGGTGTSQGEQLVMDFAGRSVMGSAGWLTPTTALVNKYQSTTTGENVEPLVLIPGSNPIARTTPNSAINPQSYKDRDYRLKSTVMWDFEKCIGILERNETGWVPFIYKSWGVSNYIIDGESYTTYNIDRCLTGYMFRKFVRNYAGQLRNEGDFNWPVIRLADVFLMYAEAVNFANLTSEKDYAVQMVNKVRHRGNLPALSASKTSTQENFFNAIEQERIVELVGEGQRSFDLRRWRKIETTFCGPADPDGYSIRDTWGNLPSMTYSHNGIFFQNASNIVYQRCYIFQIPTSEINKNHNLTQNKPFL